MSDCCEGLKEQLAALNTEISRARGEFGKLNQQLKQTNQELQQANNKIDALSNKVNSVENQLNKLKQGNDNANLTAIIIRISKLESYCNSVEEYIKNLGVFLQSIKAMFL